MVIKQSIKNTFLHLKRIKYAFNPRSYCNDTQVEFYLVDSFEIFHFLPFYKELSAKGVNVAFIAEPAEYNTSGKWFDQKSAIEILERYNLRFYTRCNPHCSVAFTTQYGRNLKKYDNSTKRIQLVYGVSTQISTAFWVKESVSKEFDYCFVNGQYYADILNKSFPVEHSVVVSYPKHLSFKEEKVSREQVLKELGINTKKPILSYFPTWDEYSSIQRIAGTLEKLRDHYFIVSKPHHCTFRLPDKRNDLEKLYAISNLVLEGNYDFARSTLIGDIVVCDSKSAASTEIPFLNNEIKMLLVMINTTMSDYRIDLRDYYCVDEGGNDIRAKLRLLENGDKWVNNRKKLIDYYYFNDIRKGLNNGVDVVMDIINSRHLR